MQVLITSEEILFNIKQNTFITCGFQNTYKTMYRINPFNPEFTIVIFTHYKSRIAAAILDL